MILTESLDLKSVLTNIASSTRDEAISNIVDHLANSGIINSGKDVFDAILERETRLSTGFGNGIAVPHAICEFVDNPVLAIATTKNKIDFKSIDDSPVQIIFLLIIPSSQYELHLQMLSRISRICSDKKFLEKLLQCENSQELYSMFIDREKQLLVVSGE